jgi:hypothetical protein
VLSDPALREAYNAATEYAVECMDMAEYLARFKYLILTVNGLGNAGWCDEPDGSSEAQRLALTDAGAAGACCARDAALRRRTARADTVDASATCAER